MSVTFTAQRLQELFGHFQGKRIAVVGDLMIDRYYWGAVRRISPEAPVPVVEVDSESHRLGGAANVARNIQALGGEPLLVGLVGDDFTGKMLVSMMADQGMPVKGIVIDSGRPTTIKTRIIAHQQHVVRVDQESKAECPEHLRHQIVDAVKYNIHAIDGIILEDYDKGTVTKDVIREVIAVARKYNKIITVDPKLKNFLEYRHVTVFKPNRRETEESIGGRLEQTEDVERAGRKLLELLDAENVLITRGEEGMSLFTPGTAPRHLASTAKHVHDVSGAGDTVIATITIAMAGGASFDEAAALGNYAGGVVVGKVGIVPITPEELTEAALEPARQQQPVL
jgi:rfaE bifunctional protein kinase chain/domain